VPKAETSDSLIYRVRNNSTPKLRQVMWGLKKLFIFKEIYVGDEFLQRYEPTDWV
jgi:hypothetical protein